MTVIIGAGPAGLSCAYTLLKEDPSREVTVLEQESFVGGIARTAEHNGNRMDIGGHRFFTKVERVDRLWHELLPEQGAPAWDDRLLGRQVPLSPGGPDPEKCDEVLLRRCRVSRIYYLRKFFDYPVSLKPRTFINMGFTRTVESGFGYLKSAVKKRDEKTLEDFMVNRFGQKLYELFFKNYTAKVWGRDPSEIGADWGAQRIKGLSLSKTVLNALRSMLGVKEKSTETSLIDSFLYPKLGPGSMWETLADRITAAGGSIEFGARVSGFEFDGGRITAVKYVKDGEEKTVAADEVVSSMPIKDLIAAFPEGSGCPDDIRAYAADLPYRDFITVGLLVDRLKIKNNSKQKTVGDLVPDTWIYVQEPEVRLGRLQIFNNWSPYMVADPVNTVWLGLEYFCSEGDSDWMMSDDEFIAMAIKELRSIDVIADDAKILDAVRIKVKKAYPAYFDSYEKMPEIREYLNGIDNLLCIGRNGQHRYNNMDHSMLSGCMAAEQIASGVYDKKALWEINTEKEYHEEKK